MKKLKKIEVGSIVAFNTLKDATWFVVLQLDGFRMMIREEGTNYAPERSDTSLVKQVK